MAMVFLKKRDKNDLETGIKIPLDIGEEKY